MPVSIEGIFQIFSLIVHQLCKEDSAPISQMRKLRFRQSKKYTQSYPAGSWGSGIRHGCLSPKPGPPWKHKKWHCSFLHTSEALPREAGAGETDLGTGAAVTGKPCAWQAWGSGQCIPQPQQGSPSLGKAVGWGGGLRGEGSRDSPLHRRPPPRPGPTEGKGHRTGDEGSCQGS